MLGHHGLKCYCPASSTFLCLIYLGWWNQNSKVWQAWMVEFKLTGRVVMFMSRYSTWKRCIYSISQMEKHTLLCACVFVFYVYVFMFFLFECHQTKMEKNIIILYCHLRNCKKKKRLVTGFFFILLLSPWSFLMRHNVVARRCTHIELLSTHLEKKHHCSF